MSEEGLHMNSYNALKTKAWVRLVITGLLAATGGLLFYVLHLPLPWLLGPMTLVLLGNRWINVDLYWPLACRNMGLIFIGYLLGTSFTLTTFREMVSQLPSMLLVTLLVLAFSAVFAIFVSKYAGVTYKTALTGSIPGGLSQMVVLGEELKGIDTTAVTFIQVTRLMSVIFIVPFLVYSPLFHEGHADLAQTTASAGPAFFSTPFTILAVFVAAAAGIIGQKIGIPTAFLLGPLIIVAGMKIAGLPVASLPDVFVDASQILMGGYIGLMMKPEALEKKARIAIFAVITGLSLIAFSFGLSILLILLHDMAAVTAFLSTAPGGMAQMGIVAQEVKANLYLITGYQMFRVFFILLFVPAFLKWLFRPRQKTKEAH